jgi:UDPglucose 6-dehydrogenase
MGLDNRIGSKFLHAGPGYGGSCFPKDTEALVEIARAADMRFEIVEAVVAVNERMQQRAVDKAVEALAGEPRGRTVAVLGLSFKPGTDDIRESPAMTVVRGLLDRGARVRVFDPVAMELARRELPDGVTYCEDAYDAAKGADVLVLATEWNEFRLLDLERLRRQLASPVVVDLRNVWDPAKMKERGFAYTCVGRTPESLVTA